MGGIGAGSFFFHGMLDEVRVYNTALSSGNVGTVMGENADAYGATYDYSALGNIAYQGGDTAYSYGSSSHVHAVTAVGPNSYTYDANGNMTARGSQAITWDTENRVTAVTGGASFVYDGDGKRIKKTENGVTMVYVNRYYQKNTTASEVTTYYYLGGRLVALKKGTSLEYVHQDHLGGTVLSTNTSANQVSSLGYLPFGGSRLSTGALGTDRKFTGQRLDNSGLYYFNARYYDPALGRFVSADTLVPAPWDPQQWNRYTYVGNNPVRYTDPTGHFCVPCLIGLVSGTVNLGIYLGANWGHLEWRGGVGAFGGGFAAGFIGPIGGVVQATVVGSVIDQTISGEFNPVQTVASVVVAPLGQAVGTMGGKAGSAVAKATVGKALPETSLGHIVASTAVSEPVSALAVPPVAGILSAPGDSRNDRFGPPSNVPATASPQPISAGPQTSGTSSPGSTGPQTSATPVQNATPVQAGGTPFSTPPAPAPSFAPASIPSTPSAPNNFGLSDDDLAAFLAQLT